MTLSWTSLLLLCIAGFVVWFWQNSLAARELANRAAMEACERLALQFLDGTVAFARLSIGRGQSGRLVLRRTYVFDYTANSIERRQGFVVVSERGVETVGYAQDGREHAARVAEKIVEPAEVIRLDDRRKHNEITDAVPQPPPEHKPGDGPYRTQHPPD